MKQKKKPDTLPVRLPLLGSMNNLGLIITDPQGSYTGIPEHPTEKPVQDADDL